MNSYQKALEERKTQHLLRTLPLLPNGIDFYSNDYLGFSKSIALNTTISEENSRVTKANGATGSRLLSGNSSYSEEVERRIARFHNAESALVYTSGYSANLGLLSSLSTRETTLFMDELVHASLIDGARLGWSQRIRFRHNDVEDLKKKLSRIDSQKIVIVESIYSMDGDICPLQEIVEICDKHDAMLIVDEAHSMAIAGEKGEGLVQQLGLENKVTARVMTYGKGPGIHGAAVVSPTWLRDYQINFSRSLIFSTAPPTHHFAAIAAMYDHLPSSGLERTQLKIIVDYFVQKRNQHEGHWINSKTHIQSLIVPGNEQVVALSKVLREHGIIALPIRKPSVAEGAERIRFCLHAYNTKEEIDLLFDVLKNFSFEKISVDGGML